MIDDTFSYTNAYMMEARTFTQSCDSILITTNLTKGINDSKLDSKPHAKFHSKYTQDFLLLQTIDCFKLINKYSGSFFSNLEFDSIYVPDCRDLEKISRNNSFNNKKEDLAENYNNFSEFFQNKDKETIDFKFKVKYLKKNSHIFIPAIFVFILFIWILY